ncbi:MAG TPA: DUF1080 domain-containing protein [Rhodothermales bacterium]|nr:DUF1080 domain-containing protein [Rhodothermales bacterium]
MKRLVTSVLGISLSLGAAAFGLTACQTNTTVEDSAGVEADSTDSNTYVLSDSERTAGWVLLSGGQDFQGWRGYDSDSIPAVWTVQDGAFYMTADSTKEQGDLMTDSTYENFELALEWKISPCGNSGIIYRAGTETEHPYETGPEYQVLDNTCHPDAKEGKNGNRTAGSAYDVYPPSQDVTKPAGEWNQTRLLVDGNHVEHWLNGVKVLEYELGSADWQQRVDGSKWANVEGYGTVEDGHIDLQDHGNPVWYRNIRIRRLPD